MYMYEVPLKPRTLMWNECTELFMVATITCLPGASMRTMPRGSVSNSITVAMRSPFWVLQVVPGGRGRQRGVEQADAFATLGWCSHLDSVHVAVSACNHDAVVDIEETCNGHVHRNAGQSDLGHDGGASWV